MDFLPLGGDLFLEERVHHDRGRARILEPAHHVHVVHQRRRPGHQGMRQIESEVLRREIHDQAFAGSAAGGVLTVISESCW